MSSKILNFGQYAGIKNQQNRLVRHLDRIRTITMNFDIIFYLILFYLPHLTSNVEGHWSYSGLRSY